MFRRQSRSADAVAESRKWESTHTAFPPDVEAALAGLAALPGLDFRANTLAGISDDMRRRMNSSPVSHAIRVSQESARILDGKPIDPDPRIDAAVFHSHCLAARETLGRLLGELLTTESGRKAIDELTAKGRNEVADIPLKQARDGRP